MQEIAFDAADYHADQRFRLARYRMRGSEEEGWELERDGTHALALGPGYRLLGTRLCGVCSTDLARHHLPFPLPQVIGHELVAVDPAEPDARYVVEINASHAARGVDHDCAYCRAGLPTHCPERRVLGIHDLPGGFGPWVLVPRHALHALPEGLDEESAVLVEPLAAALHAVERLAPRAGERVAVLGPRRLGLLAVAALAAWRAERGVAFDVLAVSRHPALLDEARALGATHVELMRGDGAALPDRLADVVIDTTGNPAGLELAVRLARREVHLKSTHGQPAGGLAHTTELVVDELGLARFEPAAFVPRLEELGRALGRTPRVAWTCTAPPPAGAAERADLRGPGDAAALRAAFEEDPAPGALPCADLAVVEGAAGVDRAIRPRPGRDERALVRPRGAILVAGDAGDASPLLHAVASRGLALSSSRCGDFARALELLARSPALADLGQRFVTHRLELGDAPDHGLARAFATARDAACIKAVVRHVPAVSRDAGG